MGTSRPKICRSKSCFEDAFKSNLTSSPNCSKSRVYRPKFRSYKPQDENLKSNVVEDAKPGNVEAVVQEQLDAAKSKVVIEELVSWRCTIKFILPTFYFLIITFRWFCQKLIQNCLRNWSIKIYVYILAFLYMISHKQLSYLLSSFRISVI